MIFEDRAMKNRAATMSAVPRKAIVLLHCARIGFNP